MRTSTFFSVASLFLIGSYSLPQPERLEASRTIENRQFRVTPGGPIPSHGGDADGWKGRSKHGGGSTTSNATKIKEREEPHENPNSMPSGLAEFIKNKHDGSGSTRTTSTNGTKIKERQEGPPPGDKFTPPEGMTWMEYMKHKKHQGGSQTQGGSVPLSTGTSGSGTNSKFVSTSGTGTNSTKVKMMKFRD